MRLPWEKDPDETPQGVKRPRRLGGSPTGKRTVSQPPFSGFGNVSQNTSK
ncbi:hypothetical protein GCM10007216_25770 [Thalassobacillus devorans]|uniref:Uncharacterized protein n=1 Tax=Thalassobacillus devorans TaxID=279813 RepID=A0ABQ1PBC2_9BACI|nr:hypothetical protein GCM10007216_25770 [Thalassobacillus devorans]